MGIKESVLDYLSQQIDSKGCSEFSTNEFSRVYGYNIKTIGSALNRLKKENKVTMVSRGGRYHPSVYKVNSEITIVNNGTLNLNTGNSIKEIAEIAVKAILMITDMALSAEKQRDELSASNSENSRKLSIIMEALNCEGQAESTK